MRFGKIIQKRGEAELPRNELSDNFLRANKIIDVKRELAAIVL